jgi:hypothetical protein
MNPAARQPRLAPSGVLSLKDYFFRFGMSVTAVTDSCKYFVKATVDADAGGQEIASTLQATTISSDIRNIASIPYPNSRSRRVAALMYTLTKLDDRSELLSEITMEMKNEPRVNQE